MREIYLLLTAFLFSLTMNAQTPEELIGWDVTGQGMSSGQGEAAWGNNNLPPTTLSDKLEATGLVRLPKYSVNVANNNSVFNTWGGAYTTSTLPLAADEEGGFTFTVTPKSGHKLSLSSLDLFYRRASYGPAQGLFQYKINDGTFSDIATLDFLPTGGGGFVLPQVDLSSVAELQEVTSDETITFRMLLYAKDSNGAGSSVNFYILNNPDVNAFSDFYLSGTVVEDTNSAGEGCLQVEYPDNSQFPNFTFLPSCTGVAESITNGSANLGEYSLVNVTSGTEYIFSLSTPIFYVTIGNAEGTEILASGYESVAWTADFDGEVRFYSHFDENCGFGDIGHDRRVQCGTPPPPLTDCEDFKALSNNLESNYSFEKPIATDIPVGPEALTIYGIEPTVA